MTGASSSLIVALLLAGETPERAGAATAEAVDALVDLVPEVGGALESEYDRRYHEALQWFFAPGVPQAKCQMISESQSFPPIVESAVFFHRPGAFEPATVVVRSAKRSLEDAVLLAAEAAGPRGDWRKHLKFSATDIVEHQTPISAELADVLDQVCDVMLGRVRYPALDLNVSPRELHFMHVTLTHGRRTGRLVGSVGGSARRFRDLLQSVADLAGAPAAQAGDSERSVLAAAKELLANLIASGNVPVDLKRERALRDAIVPGPIMPAPRRPVRVPPRSPPSR